MTRLRIFGRLHADNRLTLRAGYTLDRLQPPRSTEPTDLYAEVHDAEGTVLLREPVMTKPYSEGSDLAVRGSVTLPDQAAHVVLLRTDSSGLPPVEVARLDVPPSAPDVRLDEAPTGDVEGTQRIAWSADGDPAPVEYLVDYSHDNGETWLPIGERTTAMETSVDLDAMPGGERCRVSVTATNGVRSQTVVSNPFRIQPKPCRALIHHPIDGTTVPSELLLRGNGWWLEESRPETESIVWTSDVDGELGRGMVIPVQLTTGHHRLTLTAGTHERRGTESVEIDVAS